jgi:hypothetical protein
MRRRGLAGNLTRWILLAAWLAVATASRAAAQAREAGTGTAGEETLPRNSIALFMGATIEDEVTSFTLGLDYERRLSRQFGVGLILDSAFGAGRSFIAAAGFFWHPLRSVRLDVAPGLEVSGEEDDSFFVLRLGADYDFEVSERWSVAPNVNLDFVDGRTVWVLGAELAYAF